MNKALLEQLHRYAEDREIDYASAQYVGSQFGITWKNQNQLVEFKQLIDTYLKTFDLNNFQLIEKKLGELNGSSLKRSNVRTEGCEDITHYAAKTKVSKPNVPAGKVGGKVKGRKKVKKLKEEFAPKRLFDDDKERTFCPDCGNKTLVDIEDISDDEPGVAYACESCYKKFDREGYEVK